MVRAAAELFCQRGYAGTTMNLIAERAKVAVQTLYFTFHTKAAILKESLGAAILGFEHWDPRLELAIPPGGVARVHRWFPDLERSRTSQEALALFVDNAVDVLSRAAQLALVVTAAAASDPEVRAAAELAEHRRVEGFTQVVELLAARGPLRSGVDVRRATDVLLTVVSAETYDHLTVRRGWSSGECRRWFVDVLRQQLLRARPLRPAL
jgi:AcrR family transcriptional regulator